MALRNWIFDVVPDRIVCVCIDEGFWNNNEELFVLFEGDIETLGNVWALTVLIDDERGVWDEDKCAKESKSDVDLFKAVVDERHWSTTASRE